MKIVKVFCRYGVDLLLTLFTILFIIAFSRSYIHLPNLQGWNVLWEQLQHLFFSLLSINEIQVRINNLHMESLVSAMKEPYVYSLSILWGGFIVSFCIAMVFAYLCFNLPKRVQKVIKGVAFFIESIPDVVFIFSIQLFVIWVFQKTDLLVVKPLAGFDNVYMLPIFTIAILPSVMLFQMMILAFQNEETKTYVEYALEFH